MACYFGAALIFFFCISGLVITGTLLRRAQHRSFAEPGVPFWIRRLFRIWAAALLWLAIPILPVSTLPPALLGTGSILCELSCAQSVFLGDA